MAMLSGENSERGIAAWIEEQRWRLKKIFGFRRDDVPSYSTIQRALREVDAAQLETKLVTWAAQLEAEAETTDWKGIAIDGKVLCGSDDGECGALDILNAFSH